MRTTLLLAGLLIAVFAVPSVTAQVATPCSEVADESDLTLPASESGEAGDLHVDIETVGVYEESNDIAGLQTTGGSCDSNGDGTADQDYDADAEVLVVGPLPA